MWTMWEPGQGMVMHVVLCQAVSWLYLVLQPDSLSPGLTVLPCAFVPLLPMLGLEGEVQSPSAQPLPLFLSWPLIALLHISCCGTQGHDVLQLLETLAGWVMQVKGVGTALGSGEGVVLPNAHGCPTRRWALAEHQWQVELSPSLADTSLPLQHLEALCEDFQRQHKCHACESLELRAQLKLGGAKRPQRVHLQFWIKWVTLRPCCFSMSPSFLIYKVGMKISNWKLVLIRHWNHVSGTSMFSGVSIYISLTEPCKLNSVVMKVA
jgi:hypothetical protein